MKSLTTHDNGTRPFRVDIYDDIVKVYVSKNNEYVPTKYKYKNYVKVFKGIDKISKIHGNSILIQMKTKYVFIGDSIYEFKTNDVITKFYSSIGNSDVPYPIAVGEKNIYFMLDKVFSPLSVFKEDKYKTFHDAYTVFYGYGTNKQSHKNIQDTKKKMKGLKIIKKRPSY